MGFRNLLLKQTKENKCQKCHLEEAFANHFGNQHTAQGLQIVYPSSFVFLTNVKQ